MFTTTVGFRCICAGQMLHVHSSEAVLFCHIQNQTLVNWCIFTWRTIRPNFSQSSDS